MWAIRCSLGSKEFVAISRFSAKKSKQSHGDISNIIFWIKSIFGSSSGSCNCDRGSGGSGACSSSSPSLSSSSAMISVSGGGSGDVHGHCLFVGGAVLYSSSLCL